MPTGTPFDIIRDSDNQLLLPVDIGDDGDVEYIAAVFVFEKSGKVRVNKVLFDKTEEQGRRFSIRMSESYGRPGKATGERKCPVRLDRESGDVFLNGDYNCTLVINTLPYRYLALLIDNFPAARSYPEIAGLLKAAGASINRKIADPIGAQNFCFELKRRIKALCPELATHILHSKGRARISTSKNYVQGDSRAQEDQRA